LNLPRQTLRFSKKLENFMAAVALNFPYHNQVKHHWALGMTHAMAAGEAKDYWTVADLVSA
jgi:hypothetical protein